MMLHKTNLAPQEEPMPQTEIDRLQEELKSLRDNYARNFQRTHERITELTTALQEAADAIRATAAVATDGFKIGPPHERLDFIARLMSPQFEARLKYSLRHTGGVVPPGTGPTLKDDGYRLPRNTQDALRDIDQNIDGLVVKAMGDFPIRIDGTFTNKSTADPLGTGDRIGKGSEKEEPTR